MTILDQIASATRTRVAEEHALVPLDAMRRRALATPAPAGFPFERALRADGMSFICEVKRASPSKGLIAPDFPYLDIARDYERAGAAAVSVLTEPSYFQGSSEHLEQIAAAISIPVLRKDFVISEYQIWQARALGAAAVLLIVALLPDAELRSHLALAHELGLTALVEVHDEAETRRALDAGARVLGVNNRDLHTFEVQISTTERIAPLVPPDVVLVAESGVSEAATVAHLHAAGVDAILVGEALMRAPDKASALATLKSGLPKIKICGLVTRDDVEAVNATPPDFTGFIFAPSRRRLTPDRAAELRPGLRSFIPPVGVFVDQDPGLVEDLAAAGVIDLIQLHGHETNAEVASLKERTGLPVIKAVRIAEDGIGAVTRYPAADFLLLDSTAGSGQVFDWASIPPITPFFLAGGIGPGAIEAALAVPGVFAVDVSSGAETDGRKDPALIALLVRRTRLFGRNGRPSAGPRRPTADETAGSRPHPGRKPVT